MEKYLSALRQHYDKNREHCGFITEADGVIEVPNHAEDASNAFEVVPSDVDYWLPKALATWHTHTQQSANLSIEDYQLFQNVRDCHHFIVARETIWLYYTDAEGCVTVEERYRA